MKYDVFGFKLCVMNAAIGKIYNEPNWVKKIWTLCPKNEKKRLFSYFSRYSAIGIQDGKLVSN